MNSHRELSREDISFLRAIRDINTNPEKYENTSDGEVPANKTSIRKVTELNPSQVDYRLRDRGLDENLGLICIYDPPMTDSGYGPKSAELTDEGVQALSTIADSNSIDESNSNVISSGEIDQLRASVEKLEKQASNEVSDSLRAEIEDVSDRIDTLSEQMESLSKDVTSLQQTIDMWHKSEWGAIDDENIDNLTRAVQLSRISDTIHQNILDLDSTELSQLGDSENIAERFLKETHDDIQSSEQDTVSAEDTKSKKESDSERSDTVDQYQQKDEDDVVWPPSSSE